MAGRAPLTESSERNLAALRRSMVRSRGFGLYLLLADGPARASLLARLRAWSGAEGMPALRFFPEANRGVRALQEWLASTGEPPLTGAVLVDGDSLVAAETPVLALNVMRDRLGQLVEGPLLVILTPRSEVALSQMAPDLFDIRTATYEVEATAEDHAAGGFRRLAPLELRELVPARARLPDPEELRAQEASAEPPPLSALADAWLRLALGLLEQYDSAGASAAAGEATRIGRKTGYYRAVIVALRLCALADTQAWRIADAENAFREALTVAKEHADEREAAYTWSQLAGIRKLRGELDEALRILQDEALPVFERLGDEHGRVTTLGQIADILQARGQFDEALRMLQGEALPVFERLSDAHGRATTLREIADILQARGQLDEALRILQDEVLPVFERFGDRLALLVERENLALLHLRRDQPGDRDTAAQLLRLALHQAEAMRIPLAEKMAEHIRALQQKHGL